MGGEGPKVNREIHLVHGLFFLVREKLRDRQHLFYVFTSKDMISLSPILPSGRVDVTPVVPGKVGHISPEVLPILESLNLDAEEWVNTVESYKNGFIWWPERSKTSKKWLKRWECAG